MNKNSHISKSRLSPALAVAVALLAAGQSKAQVPITNVINTFDAAGTYGGGIGREWGPGSATFDGANGNPGGAELITVVWDPSSDTPCTAYACNGDGPNPWYNPRPIDFSLYDTLEFDIKYDNTSDITISEFNDVSTWPLSLTNAASGGNSVFQSWAGAGQIAAGGQVSGLEINVCGGSGGQMSPTIWKTNLPAAAASGWTHMKIPIKKSQPNINNVSGIVFHNWVPNTWTLVTPVTARFWVDNVQLVGTTAPPPPPVMSGPTHPSQGLNIFSSTTGNSYYDRQEILLRQRNGLSWVGNATLANPVTYSFTIVGYPNSANCEAYMFLCPNGGVTGAPDWNATNCVNIVLQGTPTSAKMSFRYKVNEPNQQQMYTGNAPWTNAPGSWDGVTTNYLETGYLGDVSNNGILGTWKIKFTSDTNITLIAPNGTTTNLAMPSYNAALFAESSSFDVYWGMQANQADGMNQAVVYSNVAVTGTPNPYSENFMTSPVLDTTTVWNTSVSGGPAGIFIVTPDVLPGYWVTHTLPDSGYSLNAFGNVANASSGTQPTLGPIIPMSGLTRQLVQPSELPAGNAAFFSMIRRTYSQLQVLFPGETNAPGTLTGKVGTPTPVANNNYVDVTVNAVDSTFHIVSSVTDTIHITSSDTMAILPNDAALVNGRGTYSVAFGSTGSQTVSATDTGNNAIPTATSSGVTVQ